MKRLIITLFTLTFALHLLPARSETYNLIGQRHLRLYTAPEPTQSYNASIDAQTVADSLCNVTWTRAISSEATSTTHASDQLDSNVSNRDRFDAALFCAFHTNGVHTAFANAAVYRYRLPDGVLPRLTRLSAKVSSDPYNALGARIVLYTNATGEIPMDCATCRGDVSGGIKLAGVAPRVTRKVDGKDYWYPNTTNVIFSQSVQLQQYLFVFVLMENYASSRGNWLEGCSWMDNLVSVTTDAPIPGWTDGQTVDLSGETDDAPADTGIRADSDNDGLTDFRERMASTVLTNLYGTTPVDASKMTTYPGQAVPDYFLPVENGSSGNWTYLGSLLTDHDFIEDWLEDSDDLFSGDRRASRYQRDARADYDDNGWDNWSEARAYLGSADGYPGRPCPKGRIKVVYNGERAYKGNVVVQAYHYHNGQIPPMTVAADETWTIPVGRKTSWYELRSSPDSYLQQGKNMFVVYNDADASGTWTPGEPYGIVTDVDVGYDRIADSIVEITDINPSMVRIDLAAALAASGFEAQNLLTDRGVNGNTKFPNEPTTNTKFVGPASGNEPIRVRIVRTKIISKTSAVYSGVTIYAAEELVDEYVNPSLVPVVSEWLLLRAGLHDLDETQLLARYRKMYGNTHDNNLTDSTYAILIGEAEFVVNDIKANNLLSVSFVNNFKGATVADKPIGRGIVDSCANKPTLTWTCPAEKTYPAFKIIVKKGAISVREFTELAPVRNTDGVYAWTAPLFVGSDLENETEYTYQVAACDAKFWSTVNWSDAVAFKMSVNGVGGDLSDQYSVYAAVKYFGHISTAGKTIRVEAFESPDFAGLPASATSVTNNSSLATTDALEPNALLIGLEAGRNYFVRAFLDSDGDGILDDGEQWGYCNYVGTNRRDIYTPRPFSFKKGATDMPKAVVYLEDVDVEPLDLSTVVDAD